MPKVKVGSPALRAFASSCVLLAICAIGTPSKADGLAPQCTAPSELTRLDGQLPRTASRIAAGSPLIIVAIGSSSTAGAGASSPAHTYPSRLAVELKQLYPSIPMTVVNRGANGEDAHEMLARFEEGVIAEKPDLVLWQVGTNSLLLDRPLQNAGTLIVEGLERLKKRGIDVVLINSQYAPKVLAKPHLPMLRKLMAAIAASASVPTFQRFELMRYWRESASMPFSAFLSPDQLHMNDWSYACVAKLLAGSISNAVARGALSAHARAPN